MRGRALNGGANTLRWLALAAGCLALLGVAALVWLSGVRPASAEELGVATATPTGTATPPALEPPEAPSNLRYEGNVVEGRLLAWDDNSDSEDGFRVRKSVGGGPPQVVATLPPDTTSAPVPETTHDEQCDGIEFSVVAFNEAGESPATAVPGPISTGCGFVGYGPIATATAEEVALPPAGGGPRTGDGTAWPLLAGAGGLALAALGGAAVIWGRRRAVNER